VIPCATEIATIQKLFGCTVVPGNNRHLDQIVNELNRYFIGELTKFSTPLERNDTPFQMEFGMNSSKFLTAIQ